MEHTHGGDRPGSWDVHRLDTVDSTNRYVFDAAARGAGQGLVAVATHQTAGRGRRGRAWDSKPGASLLFSVLFRPSSAAEVPKHVQAVGLAVLDACALVGGIDAALKWPNDVVVGERKLAGILAEVACTGESIDALVVGCGLNLNWKGGLPAALAETAISADDVSGRELDGRMMMDAILVALTARLARPDWLAGAYKSRCSTLGRMVRIEHESGDVEGLASDIADGGSLIITLDNGEQRSITVGETVHLRRQNAG